MNYRSHAPHRRPSGIRWTRRGRPVRRRPGKSLLKLAALSDSESKRKRYREATVRALVEGYLRDDGGMWGGRYNKRINLATDNELIWGPTILYEAPHVVADLLEPIRV